MDLGIAGKKAIVCASGQGLGRACAEALAAEGVHVFINARHRDRLDKTAEEMRQQGFTVTSVVGDVTTEEGRKALLAACPEPDILVNNNAGPPPRNFVDIDEKLWLSALEGNMIAPLLLIRAAVPGMRKRKFGRIINITSAMVTAPNPLMGLSSGSRAGLTAVLKGLSRECVRDNVTINNLLPERLDTDRQVQMAKGMMERDGITWEQARARQVEGMVAKRLGDPREFGAACAFLCSSLAGFICGQNLHLDGGNYPGLV